MTTDAPRGHFERADAPCPYGWRDARCGQFGDRGSCGCERPTTAECPSTLRVDGRHSWRFDGDDPYVVCAYCDRMQDALTGRVIREGRTS